MLAPRGQTVPTTLQCLTGGWGPRSIHQRTHLHSTSEQAGSISNTLPEEKRSPRRTLLPQKSHGVGESAVALPGKADPQRASKTKYLMGCHINAAEAHPESHPVQPQIGTPPLLMRIQHTLFPGTDRQKVLVVPQYLSALLPSDRLSHAGRCTDSFPGCLCSKVGPGPGK